MKIQTQNFGDVELLNFTELSESDLHYALAMRNHPEIKKWMYNQQEITETQHLSFVEALKMDNSKCYFLVKQADVIIGSINFTKIDQVESSADFGLYANPFQLKTGAGRILEEVAVSYAKDNLKLSVLNLEVFVKNERAISFYNKIGFKQAGSCNLNDQVVLRMQKTVKEVDK
ncbi:MAG: UDP-4-amino-4,6-dideoxy-N-acetyl-beta-L-altrosamine N-acetyltransferase [Methyloprofundus sp.]|nr:UDP-4-amino-4,6-dideoxy-N-acetyl-beta-L-altrosamine N-acetyltransferase [Methyloprofundus sp.]